MKNNQNGYTLLELMAVVAMIGILSAIAIPSLLNLYNPLKNTAATIATIRNAMESKAIASGRIFCLQHDSTNPRKLYGVSIAPAPNGVDTFRYDYFLANARPESALDVDLPPGVDSYYTFVGCTSNNSRVLSRPFISWRTAQATAIFLGDSSHSIATTQPDGTKIVAKIISNGSGQTNINYFKVSGWSYTHLPNY
jgi:prepilin-type N-terminal cleavage/methylation domain-containing protein